MGFRQMAIVIAFLALWIFGQYGHAEVLPRHESQVIPVTVAAKATIAKIHQYVFMAFNGGLADAKKCEMGADLFDFTQWLALPIGVSAGQVCQSNAFAGMINQLANTLVVKPRQMIASYAAELMTTNDVALSTFKGPAYVELKHYLIEMQNRPLDFAILGEPKKMDLDLKTKTQRLDVPVQLAQGLLLRLEELKIEPQAAAGIREMAFAKYTMKQSFNGDLRLEQITLPNLNPKLAEAK